ncbi:MAG: hypothetical protein ABJD11_11425 [Gemmatimonadota bacterium]
MGAAAAAIIVHKEKELVGIFQRARAVSPATAQSLAALQAHEGVALRRLRVRAVIREAGPGQFYLDEPSWTALRAMRRRILLVMLVLAVALAVAALTIGKVHNP